MFKQYLKSILIIALIGLGTRSAFAVDFACVEVNKNFHAETASLKQIYLVASCAAGNEEKDNAFEYLAIASSRGYHELEILKIDAGFEKLHDDPRWQATLNKVASVEKKYVASVNKELYEIYIADQTDRLASNIDWSVLTPRDKKRQERVKQMVESNSIIVSDDYYHAAMVYQHGQTSDFYKQANEWALHAVELDANNDDARWLACAAEDRFLWSTGKAQIWGTQYLRPYGSNQWTMDPFDKTQKTDVERAAMKVRTLDQSQAKIDFLNEQEKNNN